MNTHSDFASRFSPRASALAAFFVLGAAACAHTPALSPAGTQVALSRQAPPAGCREVGYLVGEGGGSGIAGGRWIHNDKLVEYAESDLRNKAGALGGNYVQIDPPQLGSSRGTTSTATMSGTAFRCDPAASVAATGGRASVQ